MAHRRQQSGSLMPSTTATALSFVTELEQASPPRPLSPIDEKKEHPFPGPSAASSSSQSLFDTTSQPLPMSILALIDCSAGQTLRRLAPYRQRLQFMAFATLAFLCIYTVFIAPSLDAATASRLRSAHPYPSLAHLQASLAEGANNNDSHNIPMPLTATYKYKASHTPQLSMTPEQELAAVLAFITSQTSNTIPAGVDPKKPIDPQLILGFDTRAEGAPKELDTLVTDTWASHPVVVLSKQHSSASRELKAMIDGYNLRDDATVLEIEERDDFKTLHPLLTRLTGTPALPTLLIGGKAAGPMSVIRVLHETGELRGMITSAGGVVDGKRRKGKGRKVRAPAPVAEPVEEKREPEAQAEVKVELVKRED